VLFACERRLKRAVKSFSRLIWNGSNRADYGPSRSDTIGRAYRPIEASKPADGYVRNTSIRDVASNVSNAQIAVIQKPSRMSQCDRIRTLVERRPLVWALNNAPKGGNAELA
jgi:hypothetical protein